MNVNTPAGISRTYYSILRPLLLVFIIFCLNACGGSNNDGDGGGGTPTNQAPTANAGVDQTVNEQSSVTLTASGSSDSDGSIASYVWSQTSGEAVTLSNAAVASPTFTSPTLIAAATLTFQLAVTDNDGATASDSVSISVQPVNAPPIASAGNEQTIDEQTTVTLSAAASSDNDGNIASYMWMQTAGTAVTLSDAATVSPSFTAPDIDAVTTLSFDVTVTDNEGGTASATVNIFVNPLADNFVPLSQLEPAMLLNELYFEYADMLGQKVWVLGYYGNELDNADGKGYLVDNMLILSSNEALPHHSFARIDGTLPPADWQGNLILAYGEIKDYSTVTGFPAIQPTPLISVEKYELVSEFVQNNDVNANLLTPDIAPENAAEADSPQSHTFDYQANYAAKSFSSLAAKAPGVQAQACDRAVIISGGVDESNNHDRYRQNTYANFNKLRQLGFSENQIEVFYNNGTAIDGGAGVTIVDKSASKAEILAHFAKLAEEMPGSCTLTIFIGDHGTGFNPAKSYAGARPALSGDEASNGLSHDESTFKFDARAKTYRTSASFVYRGAQWFVAKEEEGKLNVYKRVGENWQLKGSDTDNDGIISETELGGEDINGDGDTLDADYGLSVSRLGQRLTGRNYRANEWDSDHDGTMDIRVRWDGERFVVERLDNNQWKEMGRDTNSDYVIDSNDGGVDWDLDGDKADQVAFHEGINLWGSEVLWDDEFANILQPLAAKGVHIMMQMVSCYSGGFVPNLKDMVENIYVGSAEDTVNYSRRNDDGGVTMFDSQAFFDNLHGIDTDSWNFAANASTEVDDAKAEAFNQIKNIYIHEQTQRYSTGTLFDPIADNEYEIFLDLPDDLVGQIYDFEFILGLQNPRWSDVSFPLGLPAGLQVEDAPGGIRVFSDDPIEDEINFRILVDGAVLDEQVRIEFTDVNHQRLGYTMGEEGDFERAPQQISFVGTPKTCVNHTDHGQSSPSIMEWLWAANKLDNSPFTDIELTLEITTPAGVITQTVQLNLAGELYILLQIFSFGNYQMEVVGARLVPTNEILQLVGDVLFFPFTVTATETNKGQCTP
ncbi:PKD domain-containing protein [Paraglaciecola hydrolytica]|uniref:PKD/Chitinase domain-containing protein n=1 Tax=Paraglaciecola hydrolytica TaxID=1799789 RepID=A0A148KLT9_9ALTE|nr:PKD domain-containing protein [Paraglaciecola hydrolytica]KXI27250.1 hypothetical protein AX660_21190 [Paraglaciecola hydrolytica]